MNRLFIVALSILAAARPDTLLASDPVMPADVAQSAAQHFPSIRAAEAEREKARGKRLSALGAFDTRVDASVRGRLTGFYTGDNASFEVTKPLGPLGAEIYGGYRISRGDFPIYEDYNFTSESGEAKVGIVFSILRDRAIDDRRAGVALAANDIIKTELELTLERIRVKHKALNVYWRWIAAGRELKAYEELLDIAEKRDVALRREVQSGARARIFLTENAQNLTRRKEFVRKAERDLAVAANALSLYLRDSNGDPIKPERSMMPNITAIAFAGPYAGPDDILNGRPDLKLLDVLNDQLEIQRKLARNDLQPDLKFQLEAADDYGDIGPGGFERDEREVIAKLTLSVPFARRESRGAVRSVNAEIEALQQRRKLMQESIAVELRDIVLDLRAARDLLKLTRQEADQAEQMRIAELKRFNSGASDFFLVNIREQTAANAKVRLAQAEFALATANTAYLAATLDSERLLAGG